LRNIFRGRPKYVTVKAGTAPLKKDVPDGWWVQCQQCKTVLYRKDLERNLGICEKCRYHFPMSARERQRMLLDDPEAFVETDADLVPGNPLQFPEYEAKKERDLKKTGLRDAIITGSGVIEQHPVVLAIMEFGFLGGSMGSVVGEKLARAFDMALDGRLPVVVVSSSGGARMQEGIISLMQMQKTAAAVERHSRAGLLYISVLANPTTAGVWGSFASQGDVVIAEPGATVGFAGRQVIEAAVGKRVPPDLQTAETVFQNGFIDLIVPRDQLKGVIGQLLRLYGCPTRKEAAAGAPEPDAKTDKEPEADK